MMERRVSERAQGKGEGEQDVKRRKGSKTHNNKERERERAGASDGMTDRTEQYEHLMLGRFIPA